VQGFAQGLKYGAIVAGSLGLASWSPAAFAAENVLDGSGAQGARWQKGVVRLALDASVNAVDEAALEALVRAVSAWQETDAEMPTLVVERGEHHELGYTPRGNNSNDVVFKPDGAPEAGGALAITIVTFDPNDRTILDADIVINGRYAFGMMSDAAEGQGDDYDLQNVLTHEVGHFLGLGEEYSDKRATMYAYSAPGETRKRQLSEIDQESLKALYFDNPEASELACTSAPGAGFKFAWSGALAMGLIAAYQARRRALRTATGCALLALGFGFPLPAMDAAESAVVRDIEARWEQGLIVSTLALQVEGCESCAPLQREVLGGRIGNIEQRVGMLRPPAVGDRVDLRGDQIDLRATPSPHGSHALLRPASLTHCESHP
jgi:hypothetical protein